MPCTLACRAPHVDWQRRCACWTAVGLWQTGDREVTGLEEGWGRWVVADVMTADMISLLDAHHAALADWEYAPLTVALLEAAGRGVCWMKEALVVMPTLSSSRLLGITSYLLRQALTCSIPAAALPSVFTSASRSCRLVSSVTH